MTVDRSNRPPRLAAGLLDVGDRNQVAWWTMGNPAGMPVVMLHGGPGSGTSSALERLFDLGRFHLILFDQRGSGRSRPSAADPMTDMSTNTTHHLIGDIERLRSQLRIDRWIVFGASWGSTLALAYAQEHLDRVGGMVLSPVTLTSRDEIDWLYRGVGARIPEAWREFSGDREPSIDVFELLDAYAEQLEDPDPAVRLASARRWCRWEDAVVTEGTELGPSPRYDDDGFAYGFARTVTHYFRHAAWLSEEQLLRSAPTLGHVPGVLVHGLDDLSARIEPARRLAGAWPGAQLIEVPGSGHSLTDPAMSTPIRAGLDRIAEG